MRAAELQRESESEKLRQEQQARQEAEQRDAAALAEERQRTEEATAAAAVQVHKMEQLRQEERAAAEHKMRELEEQLRIAQEPEPEPDRTFANSNFKKEYDAAGRIPIVKAAQIIGKIPDFIHTYCYVHGLVSDSQAVNAEAFADRLQQEVAGHAQGGGGDLMAPVRATAELLWTSASTFRGVGDDHNKEFCSLLNAAIRDDHAALAASAASLTRGINALCLEGRTAAPLQFPAAGQVFRGSSFDDTHRDFFTVGRSYRVPGFLATSFRESKAMEFARTAEAWGRQAVMWIVRVDPDGEHDQTKRCKHVNFVTHSLVGGEAEYLFTAYSIFTVRAVSWGAGGAMHRIELDAASDNRVDAEGGNGRWATPVGSEDLPLAPHY